MGEYVLCLVTIDDMDKGVKIAHTLVREKVVACVNILPQIRSIYVWQGEVCDDPEILLIMKTRKELFDRLQSAVKELHPYEVPEVISFAIDQGLPDYLRWIDECTSPAR